MRYEFLIREHVSPLVLSRFPELRVAAGPVGGSRLFGEVPDDAALQGYLSRFAALGLQVVEMRQLPD